MSEPTAWLNGQLVPYSEMRLPVWDMGFVAGAALSEMARTFQHTPFRFADHLTRLLESCAELEFPCRWTAEQLEQAAREVVTANTRGLAPNEDLGVVWFVTAGPNPTYVGINAPADANVGIHTFRLPFSLWQKSARDGACLQLSARPHISPNTLPIQRKVRNRLHWWLADREAQQVKPGARALLLDLEGRITETSTSAIYVVIDGAICTPAENVLDSMSSRLVESAAVSCGIKFRRTDLRPDDLRRASEVFLSSTPSGLLPVSSIDDLEFPPHPIMDRLLQWWKSTTGVNPREQILSNCNRDSD